MHVRKPWALIAAPLLAAAALLPTMATAAHADPITDICGGAPDNYTGTYYGSTLTYNPNGSYQGGTYTVTMTAAGTATVTSTTGYSKNGTWPATFSVSSLDGTGLLAAVTFSGSGATFLPGGASQATPECNLLDNTVQRLVFPSVVLTRQ